MKVLSCVVLAIALINTQGSCQKVNLPDFVTAHEKKVMEANKCWPKGGLGIIMSPNDANLYAIVRSTKNEIEWGSGGDWVGQGSSTSEIIIFYDGKVWTPQSLPHDFNKNKSVIVSFDKKKIRFYDFVHMSGGYYERRNKNQDTF
jgi:hypothetical protein